MEPAYQESRMLLPKNLAIMLVAVLIITWVSFLVTKLTYYDGIPMLAIYGFGIITAIASILVFAMRFGISVYGDRVEIWYIVSKTVIPIAEIIDTRTGELNLIKNYSAWNLKGVKYRTFSAVGEDLGIGLKVTGKRVFYMSSKDPEAIAALLPKEE